MHTNNLDLRGEWLVTIDPADPCHSPFDHAPSPGRHGGRPSSEVSRRVGLRPDRAEIDQDVHPVQLPGSIQAQGLGRDVDLDTPWTGQIKGTDWFRDPRYAPYQDGAVKFPFWLQPLKHFVGVARYERSVDIPQDWADKRVELFLERVHIQSKVWWDGRALGMNNSLGTPHVYEIGVDLTPGAHVVTIEVDNRLHVDVGTNAHSVTDHTQTNWNGIIGRMELRVTPPVWVRDAQLYPDLSRRVIRWKIAIGNQSGVEGHGVVTIHQHEFPVAWSETGGLVEVEHPIESSMGVWDEFNPSLHTWRVSLRTDADEHAVDVRSGLREVGVDGTQITVNGRKIFLRGTLECAVFPDTGYPPMDEPAWQRIFQILKDYGFNHVRFHSWCPPEAAFRVADEVGFYLQVECSSWANTTTGLGLGHPVDEWLYEEARAMVRAYGHHPSFLLMAYGNEPTGRMEEYLTDWVNYWKKEDPRRLHTGGAGWPRLAAQQYDNVPEPRLHRWSEGGNSLLNGHAPNTLTDYRLDVLHAPRPIVSHEIGQWCVYPDFREIADHKGLLRPRNFEVFRDSLNAHHMGDQAQDFLMASGKLQVLCYREEIEAALRTRGFGGYQLLQANDFPGQGTALVGWLNARWGEKGYTSAKMFQRFQNSTVLLARMERRLFSDAEVFRASIEVAHFGAAPVPDAVVEWVICDEQGQSYASGCFPSQSIPVDNGTALGEIHCALTGWSAPAKYRLTVRLRDHDVENDWEFWVYPLAGTWPEPCDGWPEPSRCPLRITSDLATLLKWANDDVSLLYLPPRNAHDVPFAFTPIFWNTEWTSRQPPHTLGILCDPAHPLFDSFPTEFHTNWPWWELTDRAKAMVLDELAPEHRPIVQVIDDWNTNRRLGLVWETRLCNARVLVCGADVQRLLIHRHAARQFRKSMLDYMRSDAFSPEHTITPDLMTRLVGG